ncbi:glycogen/starch/alpha-glucan phosphorylase [Neisseria subflava]|uniref:glycogen/starch/alpha-glucan phosphorylase n=1 Tax=Neisseria subflava TaxID=28449 RepID=UPI00202A120B|nr:glycogen/starch/alpha-glucan phosphorylase [Neisseria subflava]MCL9778279.1 glycogen/starch/alpha-glucan phosphorylase [Neisseria subflava]UTG78005.1 glycogen/starch/alpha-glucan phosphorylase [Neisseria subflava]
MAKKKLPISGYDYVMPKPDAETIRKSIVYKLIFILGVDPKEATSHQWLNAAMLAARDLIAEDFLKTRRAHIDNSKRMVYYLSMEFLLGRSFVNALINEGVYAEFEEAFKQLGKEFTDVCEQEEDPGLGNGGLGRLAACFLDSLATLRIPAMGYGIRYQYGMFKQEIVDGQQVEKPDLWLDQDLAWQFARPNKQYSVRFGGHVLNLGDKKEWQPSEEISAWAYDEIIPGYGGECANPLRLWTAHAGNLFDLADFNRGDYASAVRAQNSDENISRVLYPNDSTESGRELRLKQEYFLVSASVQDIVARHKCRFPSIHTLADEVAIHLNDTHPVLAIPELMRILIDEEGIAWTEAWNMCCKIFSYTNHTLMSEALETWQVDLMGRLLPRHLDIIFEINAYFLNALRAIGNFDDDFVRRVSIIDETHGRRVRMAWLAVIGSHKVNGVAKIHSDLMITSIFADFAKIFPERFTNVTNGVTPRRWINIANPGLTKFLDKHLGDEDWRLHLDNLAKLNDKVDDASVQAEFGAVKKAAKERLAKYIETELGIKVNTDALFDIQIKRIHEYKRQALNVMHIVDRYNKILENPDFDWQPRVFIFAGKAASAYYMAKKIIRLINDVAKVINNDTRIRDLIKVVFIPNYSVSLAQIIIPAADLHEQISLAGTEASGTSNMKFALNGALCMGTLDGANVEILEKVGADNCFIFGNTVEQVEELRRNGYDPLSYIERDSDLRRVVNQISQGTFSPEEPNRYNDVLQPYGDFYQLMADFRSYIDTQYKADEHYRNVSAWRKSALINIANMGFFSSDRSIADYCRDIWYIKPLSEKELPGKN